MPLTACLHSPHLPLPGGAAAETHTLDAIYEDADGLFTIRYPAAWRPHRTGSEMQFRADRNGSTLVAVSVKTKATSPERLIAGVADLLAERHEAYQELSRRPSTIGGYPALRVEQTLTIRGIPQRSMMVAVLRHRVGLSVLALSLLEHNETYAPWFEAMAASLRIQVPDDVPEFSVRSLQSEPHVTVHAVPGSHAAREIATIAADHETVYRAIVTELSVATGESHFRGPINVYLDPSGEALHSATARNHGFAIAEADEVHALWISADNYPSLGHEMTHVIAHHMLGEGLAVCYDRAAPPPHTRARALLEAGELLPPSEILGDAWFEADPNLVYPASGSFVCWLIETYGVERFGELYVRGDLAEATAALYAADLGELQRAWRAMLAGLWTCDGGWSGGASAWPHWKQKADPTRCAAPQAGQIRGRATPQASQKRAPGRCGRPQLGHLVASMDVRPVRACRARSSPSRSHPR